MPLNLIAALKLVFALQNLRQNVVPLVKEARQVYETIHKRTGSTRPTPDTDLVHRAEELLSRVEQLESDATKQADLVAQIATQIEALAQGLQLVASRMNALLVTSAVAIIVAVVALVVVASG